MRVIWGVFFKKWVQCLSCVLEECNFYFETGGLRISSLSSCQTSCIEAWIPKESFEYYEIGVPTTLGVSLTVLNSLLKLKSTSQQVVWDLNNEDICTMHFIENNQTHVTFTISMMYLETDMLQIPDDIVYDACVTVEQQKMKYWYQVIQQVKGACEFHIQHNGLKLVSKNDHTDIQLFNHDVPCVLISEPFQCSIGFKAFENAFQCSQIADHMKIQIKADNPIGFQVEFGTGASMTLYVAPLMTDD